MTDSNNKKKRKTRSDKFPLTLHKTGQYCKKIKGKIYYFGTDRKVAYERYLSGVSDIFNDKLQDYQDITILQLANLYLDSQEKRVYGGELSNRHYVEQQRYLRKFVKYIGPSTKIKAISTSALNSYRNLLLNHYNTASGLNLNLAIIKSLFNWARKNEIVQKTPNISVLKKAKITTNQKSIFTPEQIKSLFEAADQQMKAMIWLGLNCGFGCTDCAELKWENIDLRNSRVFFPRKKTGVSRNLHLWPESLNALKNLERKSEFVFLTQRNNTWVRIIESTNDSGIKKYSTDNALSKKFSKLLKKTNIKTEKGVGFYTLRRTAATLAARSGDPFAVQRLLGHANLKMASVYVQDVSEQTDRVVGNVRKLIIQDGSLPSADAGVDAGAGI